MNAFILSNEWFQLLGDNIATVFFAYHLQHRISSVVDHQ